MSGRRGLLADCQGSVAIEFALTFVALVLFVFGAIEMGRMVWVQQVLQAAATETARCLAIASPQCPDAGIFAVASAAKRGVTDVQSASVVTLGNDACGSASGTFTKVTISYGFMSVLPAYIPAPAGRLNASACFPHS